VRFRGAILDGARGAMEGACSGAGEIVEFRSPRLRRLVVAADCSTGNTVACRGWWSTFVFVILGLCGRGLYPAVRGRHRRPT
jgi:hypothetical protein